MTTQKRRRSRGCDQCRKRRVKCDETAGYCRQCLRLGLDCSGLLEGALVVDMTKNASGSPFPGLIGRCERRKEFRKRDRVSTPAIGEIDRSLVLTQGGITEASDALAWLETVTPFQLPTAQQQSILTEQIFLAQFMDFSRPNRFANSLAPWILSVPEQVKCSQLPSFRHSIRAATTAFHAFLHQDRFAQEASYRWYIAGLNSHQKFLSAASSYQTNGVACKNIPGIEEILVPIFLCLFEVVSCTTPAGCFQHLDAACRIIQLRGPSNCQTGIVHQIFRSLRASDACVSIMDGKSSIFASKDWRTLPFLKIDQPPLHHLINTLLSIPDCLGMSYPPIRLQDLLDQLPNSPEFRQNLVQRKCRELLQDLSTWWRDFEIENSKVRNADINQETPSQQFSPLTFIYCDTFTAFVVSLYDAASLILHYTLHLISPLSKDSHLAQASSHASSILLISKYQQESCIIGFDLIRSTFALKAVEALGPGSLMKERAREMSTRWGELGLGGILKVV